MSPAVILEEEDILLKQDFSDGFNRAQREDHHNTTITASVQSSVAVGLIPNEKNPEVIDFEEEESEEEEKTDD